MEIQAFSEIEAEFFMRIEKAVYCNMATIDRVDRPRSRMMHPIWEFTDSIPIGWVISWPQSHKAKHLARNPYVSLAYIREKSKPVYIDCKAQWVNGIQEQQRIWELHRATPPPLGFDPQPHYGDRYHPFFGLLKFTPWRIELGNLDGEPIIWRPPEAN